MSRSSIKARRFVEQAVPGIVNEKLRSLCGEFLHVFTQLVHKSAITIRLYQLNKLDKQFLAAFLLVVGVVG